MASTRRQQPRWQVPASSDSSLPPIKIYNSLTRDKSNFIPVHSKKILWYACGPTVYDDAHLGHARTYVSTDIIRRILRDYFKFDVKFVENVTDVDDKIILRGRQQHLLAKFKSKHSKLEEAIPPAKAAFKAYIEKRAPKIDKDITPEAYKGAEEKEYGHVRRGEALAGDGSAPGDDEAKLKMHLNTLTSAAEALQLADKGEIDNVKFFEKADDLLLPYLDSLHGSEIDSEDHSIFTTLTKKYEDRFYRDMRELNVMDPDTITRVTEYMPQIVQYVEKIVDNGFGYKTSDGSVYFDIEAFENAGFPYARLEPWNRQNKALQADGEGDLIKKTTEKRSDADFALWKSSKAGEPSWPSPWGKGRPGWHIECSAMASDVVGTTLDIHSGGIDLSFPHHDNEIAQAEAYWTKETDGKRSHEQWVNYFIHFGHLSIAGAKMSKSLKNFTTIREALDKGMFTPRGLRILFLLGSWKDGIEITEDLIAAGNNWESRVNNFFLKARATEQRHDGLLEDTVVSGAANGASSDDKLLMAQSNAETQTFEALCNSFDTPAVMATILDLITTFNTVEKSTVTDATVLLIARWITVMVQVFGLSNVPDGQIGWAGIDIPDAAKPFVYPLSKARDEIRQKAMAGEIDPAAMTKVSTKAIAGTEQHADAIQYAEVLSQFQQDVKELEGTSPSAKDYLSLCDQLRDVKLWNLGIYLEDAEGQPAMVRPLDKELLAQRSRQEEMARTKAEAKAERERKDQELLDKGRLSHMEMFKTDEFSAWDADGIPTKDDKGEDVAKSKGKKLRKQWEAQKKLHEKWVLHESQQ